MGKRRHTITVNSYADLAGVPEIVRTRDILLQQAVQIPGWYPEENLKELYTLARPYKGGKGLEIGTWMGRSAYVLCGAGLKMTCVDTWAGLPQAPDDPRYITAPKAKVQAALNLDVYDNNCSFIQGNSVDVLKTFLHNSFDVVHIDGDHTAPVVDKDVYMGWKLVAPGGLICGDDYGEYDVREAVQKIHVPMLYVFKSRLWWAYKENNVA